MKSANDIEEPYDGKLSRTVLKPSRSGDAPAQGNVLLTPEHDGEAFRQAERVRRALFSAGLPACIGMAYAPGSTHRDPKQLLRLATTNRDAAKKIPGKNAIYPPRKPPPPAVPVAVAPELVGLIVLPRSVRSVP